MMEKVVEVEHLMAPILDGMQMRRLHAVLVSCFCEHGHVEDFGEDDAGRGGQERKPQATPAAEVLSFIDEARKEY